MEAFFQVGRRQRERSKDQPSQPFSSPKLRYSTLHSLSTIHSPLSTLTLQAKDLAAMEQYYSHSHQQQQKQFQQPYLSLPFKPIDQRWWNQKPPPSTTPHELRARAPNLVRTTYAIALVFLDSNSKMDFHLVPRGTDRNYTGFLTKTIVYSGTLVIFLACKLQIKLQIAHPRPAAMRARQG